MTTAVSSRTSGGTPPEPAGGSADHWHGLSVRFLRWLGVIVALAVAVRAVFIFGFHQDFPLSGDAWVYHHEGRFVANGRGFVNPVALHFNGHVSQAADHPPLYVVTIAIAWLLGARSPISQIALNGVFGVVTVVLIALTARRIGGDRVGLVAGVVAAFYPGLWAWNGQLLSETVSVLASALVIFLAYRYLDTRARRDLVLLAVSVGLAALARSELILFIPLLVLPVLVTRFRIGRDRRELVRNGILALAIIGALLAPWTLYNLSRFERPVLLGTGFGRALDSGACGESWDGSQTGFWDVRCLEQPMGVDKLTQMTLDESEMDALYRQEAIERMTADPAQVPQTLALRVGRMFQLYDPLEQLDYDQLTEGREPNVSAIAWGTYYLLAIASIAGVIALRRRFRSAYPIVMPVVIAAIGAMIAFGTTRYRAPAEPSFVVLGALGFDWLLRVVEPKLPARWRVREPTLDDIAGGAGSDGDALVAGAGPRRLPLPVVLTLAVIALAVAAGLAMLVAGWTYHLHGELPPHWPAPPLPPA